MTYCSVLNENITRKVIEKSKFITAVRHVESEEEARAFIAEVGAKYSDATHNCYAFIPDILGNLPRFSDDGEPQGTAGMPMLEVLKNNRLVQVAAVVTRYFGGIKLGAGGLVRAYSGCVAENLACAQIVRYETCVEILITVDYPRADAATRFIGENGGDLLQTDYANEVVFRVAVKKSAEEDFCAKLTNRLNGRVQIQRIKEYFYPFKL